MKHQITFLLAFCFISCSQPKEEQLSYSDSIVQHFPQWDTKKHQPEIPLSTDVQEAVLSLANDTIVPTTRFRAAYAVLRNNAAHDELIVLTSHPSPVIRCHAYTALIEKGYPAIHRICFEHFNDTVQKVTARVEGGSYPLSVRTWMIYSLRPGSGSNYSFEPKLYRRYIYEYNDLGRSLKKNKQEMQ